MALEGQVKGCVTASVWEVHIYSISSVDEIKYIASGKHNFGVKSSH
ncbi:hypothetical protein M7I_6380 [Glarea lozoyensis 74030]|uniref:Uncharacterized protein n=1 Tax=Glarea lozoyensis (strain ATCC 74030 / MF5533) TaxID=1104152 RepID=H0EUE6_GLAL7|nr:hypothetical protein M7I_6380 [Glarea lozoyensis 74030]